MIDNSNKSQENLPMSWEPMSLTSLPYQSHVLKQETKSLYFLPSNCAMAITAFYCGLGSIITIEGLCEYLKIIPNAKAPLFPTTVGILILLFSLINWSIINRKIYFSGKNNLCLLDYRIWKKTISTEAITGLQFIPTRICIDDYSYSHSEIVLITVDKKRILLLAHGLGDHLRSDAHKLSKFLKVPLWEGKV